MRLYKFSDRAKVYTKIWQYQKRREALRERYDVINGAKTSDDYKRSVKNLNTKIASWKKSIRVMDERHIKIVAIANYLCTFMGENVKDGIKYTSERHRMARGIFYKYCLENNISASLVSEYVGAARGDIAARGRLAFTKSFETHSSHRDMYYRFKTYIEERSQEEVQ